MKKENIYYFIMEFKLSLHHTDSTVKANLDNLPAFYIKVVLLYLEL